jgi:hypothetical protein
VRALDQAVGQRRFSVVYVSDNAEVPYLFHILFFYGYLFNSFFV